MYKCSYTRFMCLKMNVARGQKRAGDSDGRIRPARRFPAPRAPSGSRHPGSWPTRHHPRRVRTTNSRSDPIRPQPPQCGARPRNYPQARKTNYRVQVASTSATGRWERASGRCRPTPAQVAVYLAERLEAAGHKPATLRVAAAAIAFVHKTAGVADPCASPAVQRTLRSATRKAGKSQKQGSGPDHRGPGRDPVHGLYPPAGTGRVV